MQIEQSLRIQGANDFCQISRTSAGKIHIDGITLNEDEQEDFVKLLAQALEALPTKTLDGKLISSKGVA